MKCRVSSALAMKWGLYRSYQPHAMYNNLCEREYSQLRRWLDAGGFVMEQAVRERPLSPEDEAAVAAFMAEGLNNQEEGK
jgi:hypothetical protein